MKEISTSALNEARTEAHAKSYPTIDGSTLFQVMVINPNQPFFKAAPYLCVCSECMKDYGSCSLFQSYELLIGGLKKIYLRSDVEEPDLSLEIGGSKENDFIVPGTYCAVAADKSSSETFWLVKIKDSYKATTTITDDYSNRIAAGHHYIEGQFLEKEVSAAKGCYYKLKKEKTYFFVESVVYLFVQVQSTKKKLFITNDEHITVVNYVEQIGYSHI